MNSKPSSPIVDVALSCVGQVEVPYGSNRGPDVDVYTGGNAVPYCALWVCWLFRSMGTPLPGDYEPSPGRMSPLCSVTNMERMFSEHDWLVREPQVGDVVFYATRGQSDKGPGRHVGLVVDVGQTGFQTVEANWNQGVRLRSVQRTDPHITGFGRVP